jgi:hypothetical protein
MNKRLEELRAGAKDYLTKLSDRERGILALAAIMIALFVSAQAYKRASLVFELQTSEREQLTRDLDAAGVLLERYSKLKAKRNEIENVYKEVEIKEGALSLLERMVEEKAGVPKGQFTIKEMQARQFGGNYEQQPFTINLSVSALEKLTDLLQELVSGPHRMVISRLHVKKAPTLDKLNVDIDVSTFKRVNSGK